MLTDTDLQKIQNIMKAELAGQDKRFDKKLAQLEENIHNYILDGVRDVVDGIDDLLKEHSVGKSYPHHLQS